MKVLLIAPQPFFTERGTPIAVRQLVETLCADGHQVDLLTYPFGLDIAIEGLTIHRCRRFPGIRHVRIGFSLAKVLQDLPLFAKLHSMCRRRRYDVVHAVEESVYAALLLRRVHRAKVIYDMDSSLVEQLRARNPVFRALSPLLRRIEAWAIRSADLVAPVCQELAVYAGKLRDDEVPVLHDVPVDFERHADSVELLDEAAPDGRLLALYVGNLESYQGIDLIMDAVSLLPEPAPVQVVVVGGSMSEARRFQRVAAGRGIGGCLRFVGPRPVSQLRQLLAQADILLSPRTEGGNTPLKLYSYMDSGRAILATRLATHTQVLDDSTAFLVEAEPIDYARGILRLASDESLRRALGESAKRRVTLHYSLSSFRKRVRSVYTRSQSAVAHSAVVSAAMTTPAAIRTTLDRRSSRDRRRSPDRRTSVRSSFDRRVGDRRTLALA